MSSEANAVASPAPIDLTELASRISSLGENIKLLKSSSEQPDADAISAAVAALLDAKRLYAHNNGGVGVDGKPWEEPLTKSQKKKLEKEKKAAAAEAEAEAAPGTANEGEHGVTLHSLETLERGMLVCALQSYLTLLFSLLIHVTPIIQSQRIQKGRKEGRSQGQKDCIESSSCLISRRRHYCHCSYSGSSYYYYYTSYNAHPPNFYSTSPHCIYNFQTQTKSNCIQSQCIPHGTTSRCPHHCRPMQYHCRL